MLKKEFNEILRQVLFFIVMVVGLPVLVLIMGAFFKWSLTYNQVFFILYQIGLFTFAVLTGVTLFSAEKKQGGLEYMLTLPYSRMQLLGMKILPRLTAISVLLILNSLYLGIVTDGGQSLDVLPVLPLFYLITPIFFIFLLSVSLSASHDNIIVLAIWVIFIFIIQSLFIPFLPRIMERSYNKIFEVNKLIYVVLTTLVFLVPFVIAFVMTFRKFDLHPTRRFNRKYVQLFVPLLFAGLLSSVLLVNSIAKPMSKYGLWYLTGNNKVIETDWNTTRIYDQEKGKVATLEASFYSAIINPLESGGYLYANSSFRNTREYQRLNTANNTVETIYTANKDHMNYAWGGWLFKDTFALCEGNFNKQNIMLVLVNLDTRAVSKIKLPAKLQEKYRVMSVFGVEETNGKRAWLIYGEKGLKFPVFRVWEDGSSQELAVRGRAPYYVNNMVITSADDGMVFYRLTPVGCEEIKSDSRGRSVLLYPLNRVNLNNVPQQKLYGIYPNQNGKWLMRVDLEKLEITKLLEFSGRILYYAPGECYLLDSHLTPRNIYRVQPDGQLQLLRTFSGFNTRAGNNFMQRSRNGIITRENDKLSVYAYPDLRELPFKDFN